MTPSEPLRVALVGAESTGKTQLAAELAAHAERRGLRAVMVPEVLRGWCDQRGCFPRQEDQESIAREQARLAQEALPCDWLVADATPLMVAVYSDIVFRDRSLYPFALEHHRGYGLTLLTGLDLPWVADPLRDGPRVREPVDTLVRAALDGARLPYSCVYGAGDARLRSALCAIDSIAKN